MIRTTQNSVLFNKKDVNNFWQSVDAILEEGSVVKQLFDSKLLVKPLPSSSIPKITVVKQV